MPTANDFRVKLLVEGVPAEEYGVTVDHLENDITEVHCAVECVTGAQFACEISYLGRGHSNRVADLLVDGKFMEGTAYFIDDEPAVLENALIGDEKFPLRFAAMRAVPIGEDPDEDDVEVADTEQVKDVGRICVQLSYARVLGPARNQQRGIEHFSKVVLTELQNKNAKLTHTAEAGESLGQWKKSDVEWEVQELTHRFIFEYMSRDMLDIKGYLSSRSGSNSNKRGRAGEPVDLTMVKDERAPKRPRLDDPPVQPTYEVVELLDSSDDEDEDEDDDVVEVSPATGASGTGAVTVKKETATSQRPLMQPLPPPTFETVVLLDDDDDE
ncbi:hypothetical protein H9P43_000857 [Blastocladiella emersonii ATCC 22665]|nr:hypothetical protein H9P43_000857 [Blastocladiella emersonii ATCC 22665]